MTPSLPQQLLAIEGALSVAAIPHAFGGAIALAYYTLEPRGTRDLDLNVFLDHRDARRALAALPAEVTVSAQNLEQLLHDGQARLWWDETPVDLFFDTVPFHEQAARHARSVPFSGTEIPILGPIELVVFKALFDRTKDWADIESVVAAESVDVMAARDALGSLIGAGDYRLSRFDEAVSRGLATAGR